ncbi:general transcription factor IIH subunit 3 isoform X1 [Halichoerus grypus]
MVLGNSHLFMNRSNKLAVIASHIQESRFLYPGKNGRLGDFFGEPGNPSSEFSPSGSKDGKYELFTAANEVIAEEIKDLMTKSDIKGQHTETLLAGSLAKALCYIHRMNKEVKDNQEMKSRILVIKAAEDSALQYMNFMNVIFAAQKQNILIDACVLDSDSGLLQQCLLTPRRSWLYPEFKCSASPTLTSLCLGQMQALCVPDLHSQLLRQHLPLDIQKHLHFNLSEAELLIFSTLPPRGLPITASGSSVHQPKIQVKILTLPCFFSSSLSSPLANPFDLIFEIVPESHHMSSPSLLPLKWRIVVSVNWSLFLRLPCPLKSVFKTVRMKLSKYKSDLVTHLLKTLAWHLLTHRLKPRFLPWPSVPPAQYGFWVSLCPHGIPLFTPPTLGSLLCFKTTGLPPPEGVCVCCSLCF